MVWRRLGVIIALLILTIVAMLTSNDSDSISRIYTTVGDFNPGSRSWFDSESPSTRNASCTFHLFKDYVATKDFYPQELSWIWTNNNTTPSHFQPSLCVFKYGSVISTPYIDECLSRQKIQKFLFLGDSTGHLLFLEVAEFLKDLGFTCQIVKEEHTHDEARPDPIYYVKEPGLTRGEIRTNTRGCHKCKSIFLGCTKAISNNASTLQLQLEFVVMDHYWDTELTTHRSRTLKNCIDDTCTSAESTPEFLFTEYLRNDYPDVIFLLGNHHFKALTMTTIRKDIRTLAKLLNSKALRKTLIVWLTTASEDVTKKPKEWLNLWPGSLAVQKRLRIINQYVFDILKPLMTKKYSNFLPFLDLQSASKDVLTELNIDGVHMKPSWYRLIMSDLLQTLCESNLTELLGEPMVN